jgi:hypothetical protein
MALVGMSKISNPVRNRTQIPRLTIWDGHWCKNYTSGTFLALI